VGGLWRALHSQSFKKAGPDRHSSTQKASNRSVLEIQYGELRFLGIGPAGNASAAKNREKPQKEENSPLLKEAPPYRSHDVGRHHLGKNVNKGHAQGVSGGGSHREEGNVNMGSRRFSLGRIAAYAQRGS